MALCAISVPPSNHYHHHNSIILQNLSSFCSSTTPRKPTQPHHVPHSSTTSTSYNSTKWSEKIPISQGRRMLNLSTIGAVLSLIDIPFSKFLFFSKALASQLLELESYTDSKEGFTLLIPNSWTKVLSFLLSRKR